MTMKQTNYALLLENFAPHSWLQAWLLYSMYLLLPERWIVICLDSEAARESSAKPCTECNHLHLAGCSDYRDLLQAPTLLLRWPAKPLMDQVPAVSETDFFPMKCPDSGDRCDKCDNAANNPQAKVCDKILPDKGVLLQNPHLGEFDQKSDCF